MVTAVNAVFYGSSAGLVLFTLSVMALTTALLLVLISGYYLLLVDLRWTLLFLYSSGSVLLVLVQLVIGSLLPALITWFANPLLLSATACYLRVKESSTGNSRNDC